MLSTKTIATTATRQIPAVVISSGLMAKTVKARIGKQEWNSHIRKKFNKSANVLVHDPLTSLRTGDIISISPGWRASKHVHHVLHSIIAPFGSTIEDRPRVMSEEERIVEREARLVLKGIRKGKRKAVVGKGGKVCETLEEVMEWVRWRREVESMKGKGMGMGRRREEKVKDEKREEGIKDGEAIREAEENLVKVVD